MWPASSPSVTNPLVHAVMTDAPEDHPAAAAEERRQQSSSSWRDAAGRSDGPQGYKFGDLSRSLARNAKEVAERTRTRWREIEVSERGTASAAEDIPSSAPVVVTAVTRGAGQAFGAAKGLVSETFLGAVKGGVALTDKLYEASSSTVANESDRREFNARVNFHARQAAAEAAPLFGAIASSFAQGALEGRDAASRGLHTAWETAVPEGWQQDLAARLEQRFGAVMEHLIEPAVLEAVQNLYIRQVKPSLVNDRMAPQRVRQASHLPPSPTISHHLPPSLTFSWLLNVCDRRAMT